jgi:hypothetical protein
MMWLALVLAAITGRTELLDETFQVPRSQTRALTVELRDRPVTVEVDFKVISGRSGVRVLFLTSDNAKRFEDGHALEVLAQTDYAGQGRFRYLVGAPGEYRILLDNRLEGREPAEVKVKIALLTSSYDTFLPRRLPERKRQLVTAVALGGFFLVAGVLGRALWRGTRPTHERYF